MKIVNEKGKLFGLINIVDLSIIILIVLIGGVLAFKMMGKDVGPTESATQDITVTFRASLRTADQAKTLKQGNQLISLLKPVDAYIKSVALNPLPVPISTADGKAVYSNDPVRKELIVKFTMKASKGNGIIKLDSQDVCVGKEFTLKTHTFESKGSIEAID
jgi:hypothetical protein